MVRGSRWVGAAVFGLGALVLTGCASGGGTALPAQKTSLAADITTPAEPRLARMQRPEPGGGVGLRTPIAAPPPARSVLEPAAASLLPQPGPETQQTSLVNRSEVRVSVRAWVNGRPLFDDEVMQVAGPTLGGLRGLPEPQRSEKMAEVYNKVLETMIDQEVLYQDAVKKLEKNSPRALDSLKEYVNEEFERQLRKMREAGVPEDQVKELEPVARRIMERSLIQTEYARNRIRPALVRVGGLEEIKEYYDTHQNEFQSVDRVKWQNVFIAVGPKHPTLADARRFAEGLLASLKAPEDFAKLTAYDDGDSKLRGGEGLGQRRGEIRPAACEEALFSLRDGQVGPLVEIDTGVHLLRLVKREHAGQMPLDEKTQQLIRKKLEGQMADREYRRIVRELRSRAVVRIERETP